MGLAVERNISSGEIAQIFTSILSNKMKTLITIIIISALVGCANPYAKYYNDATFGYDAKKRASIQPLEGTPKAQRVPAVTAKIVNSLASQGFIQLGFSEFTNTDDASPSQMVAHAKKIGAQYVFYSEKFSHAEQGVKAIPVYTPGQTSTTNTSGNANVWAPGQGSAYGSYSGTSTTTTPGTFSTSYVPATYYHKTKTAFFYAAGEP